jgi:hypothetical protein
MTDSEGMQRWGGLTEAAYRRIAEQFQHLNQHSYRNLKLDYERLMARFVAQEIGE